LGSIFGSSSTEEVLAAFVAGIYSFKTLAKECCHHKELKTTIKSMKNKGYKKTRKNARQAMLRRGYALDDWTWEHFIRPNFDWSKIGRY
jgi:hypothetical protein